jgi:hypothetical protein
MLRKGLTLDETWDNCLDMWKWIAEVVLGNPEFPDDIAAFVADLKEKWIRENFGRKETEAYCFFCDYDTHHENGCGSCPAALMEEDFDCNNALYDYETMPVEFYNKINELNFIRTRKM